MSETTKATLEQYLNVAKNISEDPSIPIIEADIHELHAVAADNACTLFVSVCTSAGTGKTDFAFGFLNSSLFYIPERAFLYLSLKKACFAFFA